MGGFHRGGVIDTQENNFSDLFGGNEKLDGLVTRIMHQIHISGYADGCASGFERLRNRNSNRAGFAMDGLPAAIGHSGVFATEHFSSQPALYLFRFL